MKCREAKRSKKETRIMAVAMSSALLLGNFMPVYADETEKTETVTLQQSESTAAGQGIDMTTDYPGITVKAGDTVSFPLDFVSLDGQGHDVSLSEESTPDEIWETAGYFSGNSNEITQVHVNGATLQNTDLGDSLVTYKITVPEDTEDGTYTVVLKAETEDGSTDTLQLNINVNELQNGQSTFTSEYPSQEGASGTTFTFDATLVNNRLNDESFALSASAPDGWQVMFTPSDGSTNVASIDVTAGSSEGMTITVTPPETVEKGEYTIPITAISGDDSLSAELTVGIIGSYDVTLSTIDQKLSFDAYENKPSTVTLTVTNNGNVDLENLNLSSSAPTDWEVSFSESTIDTLEAGATKEITATVTPSDNCITGDYVTEISVSNSATSDVADFRVSIKTSTTWGFVAIGIIVVLAAILALIFKKYGRR